VKDACAHERKRVVWSDVGSSGDLLQSRQLRHQCLDCGGLLSQQLPHREARPDTPNVDKEALQRCNEAREQKYKEHFESYLAAREQENAEWWNRYNDHLASEKRQRIRKVIFERDAGICRGCLRRKATQVHHLTYQNVCDEFAFQLVSICEECHQRFHAEAS